MLNLKKVSVSLVKSSVPYINVSTEKFEDNFGFDRKKLVRIIGVLREQYPKYPIYIDIRKSDMFIVSEMLRLKAELKEFNINLLVAFNSPHYETLRVLNATSMFNIVAS